MVLGKMTNFLELFLFLSSFGFCYFKAEVGANPDYKVCLPGLFTQQLQIVEYKCFWIHNFFDEIESFRIYKNDNRNIAIAIQKYTKSTIAPKTFSELICITNSDCPIPAVYLNNTGIKVILQGTFTNRVFFNLRYLHLEDNKLEDISGGIFTSLPNLKILHLERNKITELSKHTFAGAGSLKALYIHHNKLSSIFQHIVDYLPELKLLDISYNPFKILNIDLSSLPFVYLSGLNLHKVEMKNISQIVLTGHGNMTVTLEVATLTNISLSHNGIPNLNNFAVKDRNLSALDFSSNQIEFLSEEMFLGLDNLTYLNLGNNAIVSLPHGIFHDLTSLQSLDLSKNNLTSLQYGLFDTMRDLRFLNLSFNFITELNPFMFRASRNLSQLYLDNNELSTLDLHYLVSLKEVSFNDNPWKCDELSKIIYDLEFRNVRVLFGSSHKENNVHKIACSDLESSKNIARTDLEVATSNSGEFQKSEFVAFFNSDFKNTVFYKFFKKFNITIQSVPDLKNVSKNDGYASAVANRLVIEDQANGYMKKEYVISILQVILLCSIVCILLYRQITKIYPVRKVISSVESRSEIQLM